MDFFSGQLSGRAKLCLSSRLHKALLFFHWSCVKSAGPLFYRSEKWALEDLNPRPTACKAVALTAAPSARKLQMRGRGFEPPRPCGHQHLKLARLPLLHPRIKIV